MVYVISQVMLSAHAAQESAALRRWRPATESGDSVQLTSTFGAVSNSTNSVTSS